MLNKHFKNIIVIGGYAQSGKTSSIEILRDLGVPCASTSEYLGKVLDSMELNLSFKKDLDYRSKKILLAEEILVPNLSRSCLVYPAVSSLMNNPCKTVAIETIGGSEWELAKEIIQFLADKSCTAYRFYEFNIRRATELKGVDIRELLVNGLTIQNDNSQEDLREKLSEWVDFINFF